MDVAASVVDEVVSVDVVVVTEAAGEEDVVALAATEGAEEEVVVDLVTGAAGVEDEVLLEVVAVVVPAVVVATVDVVVGEDEAAPGEEPGPSSSPIPTPESSLPKAKTTCWLPKTSFLASLSTARSGYRSKLPNQRPQRPSTVSGTPSDLSWLLVSLVEWVTFSSSLAQRCFTSVLPVELLSAMLLTSLVRKALSTPWNSPPVLAVT